MIKPLKQLHNFYLILISSLGILTFVKMNNFNLDNSDWVLIYALIAAVLFLLYFTIQMPPEGNFLSMDSSIYLASIFIFGLEVTLHVLILSMLIYGAYERRIAWWKHLFNFSIYTIMIVCAHEVFIYFGGVVGAVDKSNMISYITSLLVYFLFNVLLIGTYFMIVSSKSNIPVLKGMLKQTIVSYVTTLLLSLVLSSLLIDLYIFGLFLFTSVAVLLSVAFKQHFLLYLQLSEKANKDQLTGLNNHAFFKELLEQKLLRSKDVDYNACLVLIDLDDFKKYNDLFGHIQGDKLLSFFGKLLTEEFESEKFDFARYGGEEFVILMNDTNQEEAYQFINRFRKKVNDTYFEGVEMLPYGCLTFSGGIIQYCKEVYSSSDFLNKADQAMYDAKAQGKNVINIFDENGSMQQTIKLDQAIQSIEQQLRIFLSKDIYTYRHSQRVYQYAREFSEFLSLSEKESETLILGALIHDIGKLEIPRDIINKKGKLTPHEWEIMKKHVIWGKEIISTNKEFHHLIPLAELHHERFDGGGYPYGLKGNDIPKLARILCVIDSFDAMTTERPYQRTKSFEEAIDELRKCSGKQFDPQYVDSFIKVIQDKYRTQLIG